MVAPESQSGAYPTFHHVACRACGQLTRIEVCYPVVQASRITKANYCSLCGTPAGDYQSQVDSNGSQFLLVASALFKREPSQHDVAIIESIYPEWNAYNHPTFRDYLKSLVAGNLG